MTSKQCNSCKYLHIWRNNKHEDTCFLINPQYFMKNKNCPNYINGSFNEVRKEYRMKFNKELP